MQNRIFERNKNKKRSGKGRYSCDEVGLSKLNFNLGIIEETDESGLASTNRKQDKIFYFNDDTNFVSDSLLNDMYEDNEMNLLENNESEDYSCDFNETNMLENAMVLPTQLLNSPHLNYLQIKEMIRKKSKQAMLKRLSKGIMKTTSEEKLSNTTNTNVNKSNMILVNNINININNNSDLTSTPGKKLENILEEDENIGDKENNEKKIFDDQAENTLIEYNSLFSGVNLTEVDGKYSKTDPDNQKTKEFYFNTNEYGETNYTTQAQTNTNQNLSDMPCVKDRDKDDKKCIIF
jgi:hypothetical protein